MTLQTSVTFCLGELAGKADITVANDGSVTIDGQTLVNSDGSTINELTITSTVTPITFELDGAAVTIDSGTLGGMVEAAAYINAMLTNLDTMSNELIHTGQHHSSLWI